MQWIVVPWYVRCVVYLGIHVSLFALLSLLLPLFVVSSLLLSLSCRYVLGQYFAFWCICVINPAHGTAYRIQVRRSSRGREDARVYPI